MIIQALQIEQLIKTAYVGSGCGGAEAVETGKCGGDGTPIGSAGAKFWGPNGENIIYRNAATSTGNKNTFLINMQYIPKITVEKGKWYRMRMTMSSVQDGLAWRAPRGCEMQLLAKDGIYLNDAPRKINVMILAAGNRAD